MPSGDKIANKGQDFREINLPENRGRLVRGSELAKSEVLKLIAGDDDGKVHGKPGKVVGDCA